MGFEDYYTVYTSWPDSPTRSIIGMIHAGLIKTVNQINRLIDNLDWRT